MRFIGDVHGEFDAYLALIEGVDCSIQVGDMGLGFGQELPKLGSCHGFIRGNHDDPEECKKHPNWFSDGLYDSVWKVFFVGGAWSIDWEWRQRYEMSTGRKIWWSDEECSVRQLQEIIDHYEECKPRIVVTHDCPTIMAHEIKSQHEWDKSKTRQALDRMFEIHKPELWLFGHHHVGMVRDISGVRFIALAEAINRGELNYIDLEV